jgi:hypothetical protein
VIRLPLPLLIGSVMIVLLISFERGRPVWRLSLSGNESSIAGS